MIRIAGVSKTFSVKDNKVEALKNVSLDIAKGDIYGIIGMSGAGKSTLVRCLNFLERPTEGTVYVEGQDLSTLDAKQLRQLRKHVAMIFQNFNLLMQRTVLDNVCFPMEIAGVDKKTAREKAREFLKVVELSDKEKAYPAQLSGGQKQRCACARAIINQPKLILADEPTGALDSHSSQMLLSTIQSINEDLGATILMVTHDAFSASYANRILFLRDGAIFTEIFKGSDSRRTFFEKILDVLTMMGGGVSDVR